MAALLLACLSIGFALDTAQRQTNKLLLLSSANRDGMRDHLDADPDYLNSYNASGRQQRKDEAVSNSDATTESQNRIRDWNQRGNDRYEVQVHVDQNFCYYLSQDEYRDVGTCAAIPEADFEDCRQSNLFHMLPDGSFTVCTWVEEDNRCADGEVYSCPWTSHMLALERAQNSSTETCFGDILESKRSLDGLLRWVNETYMALLVQTEIIRQNNYTIYLAIEDQQRAEHSMIDCKIHCDNHAIMTNETTLGLVEHQLHLLEDIARPRIRSKINDRRGYYESAGAQKFDAARQQAQEGWNNTDADDKRRKANILVRDIPEGASFAQVDEVQLSDSAGQLSKKWTMMNLLGFDRDDEAETCHERRTNLSNTLINAWHFYADEYRRFNGEVQLGRTLCHDMCEELYHIKIHDPCSENFPNYTYNASGETQSAIFVRNDNENEPNPCVDHRITQSAQNISNAQSVIAVLEPRLHDLEHAVNRMRSHLRHQNKTCSLDRSVSDRLHQIHLIVKLINECPGRNDFILTIPHWSDQATPEPPVNTPAPTPWFDRDDLDIPENMAGNYPSENMRPVVPAGFVMLGDETQDDI